MPVRPTSIASYYKLLREGKQGTQQEIILDFVKSRKKPVTRKQIAKHFDDSIMTRAIVARVNELVEEEKLFVVGEITNEKTGRTLELLYWKKVPFTSKKFKVKKRKKHKLSQYERVKRYMKDGKTRTRKQVTEFFRTKKFPIGGRAVASIMGKLREDGFLEYVGRTQDHDTERLVEKLRWKGQ